MEAYDTMMQTQLSPDLGEGISKDCKTKKQDNEMAMELDKMGTDLDNGLASEGDSPVEGAYQKQEPDEPLVQTEKPETEGILILVIFLFSDVEGSI